jgi:hypothetical protein
MILGCTAAGGPHAVQAEPAALQTLMRQGMTPEESKEAIIPFIYDPDTPRERIDEDMAIRMEMVSRSAGIHGPAARNFRLGSLQPHRPNYGSDARHSR